ncbi:protrudin isoform 3-T3 [Theristicus caerulescens]
MQAVERDGAAGGPEGAAGGGEAPPEPSPPKAAAAFDLLELVRSYRRLEFYLEPLRDAAEGVRSLLRRLVLGACPLGGGAGPAGLPAGDVPGPALGARAGAQEVPQRPAGGPAQGAALTAGGCRPGQELPDPAGGVPERDVLQLRGSVPCTVLGEPHCLFPVSRIGFYGALLGSVCVLYLLPLCWVLAILNSTLFLGNTQFYHVIMELKASIEQCVGTKPLESTPEPAEPLPAAAPPDRTPTPTSTEDLTPGSVEEAEEAEPDEEFKDAIEENQLLVMEDDESSQCSADFDLSLPDNGFMSKNEVIRSKVSRLTERLRKRYPSNNFGSCTGCAATFSVLKKRRSCSNCGNSFCSRCCSFKVPKAVMGATAPEAQRETVFVCALCNQVLIK